MNAVMERTSTLTTQQISIDRYHLLHLLKNGGMAKIYLAYDTYTHRNVAIKLAERGAFDEKLFLNEVRSMKMLHHPHILPLLDAGRSGQWNYIVMPYIPDGTLQDYINQQILTIEEISFIFKQLVEAVQYMHSCGITHRDIKPTNILVDGDTIYLADFGIAIQQEEEVMYFDKPLMGTPTYIAPETYEGEVSRKSDLYSLGVVLYQMMTGRVPFEGKNAMNIHWKQKNQRPLSPSLFNPYATSALEEVILRALEGEPETRFQTVEDFALTYQKALAPSLLKRLTSNILHTVRSITHYPYEMVWKR